MQLNALHDYVLVRPVEPKTHSVGGIALLPSAGRNEAPEGEVVAAGQGRTTNMGYWHPMTVRKGDRVVYDRHKFEPVEIAGEKLVVLREPDVIAVIEG